MTSRGTEAPGWLEYATVTTVRVDLIEGWNITWPRIETEDMIIAVGSARPLEDAMRIACRIWSTGWSTTTASTGGPRT